MTELFIQNSVRTVAPEISICYQLNNTFILHLNVIIKCKFKYNNTKKLLNLNKFRFDLKLLDLTKPAFGDILNIKNDS